MGAGMHSIVGLAALTLAASASAHVSVSPQQSAPGAREKYELRVPNERKSATITVEFRFPPNLRVTAVYEYSTEGNVAKPRLAERLDATSSIDFPVILIPEIATSVNALS